MTRLGVFRDPASVAVVGASGDRAKWGYWLARGALRGGHRRSVGLVNRRAAALFDRPCAPELAALDEVPELVALCVPGPHVAGVVEQGLALGVRGFLGITAGIPGERELAARIRAGGARLVGANSLGIYDGAAELELAWGRFTPGPLAIVSQSGQLGSELATLGARVGLGVSRFVSIGNQSDVSATEVLADLADHEPTRVVALYLESFDGAEGLFDAVAALRAAGKPTVLLTVGAGEASSRLARSHTGSLTSRMDVVDAACRRSGVPRAESPAELLDLARACLSGAAAPAGRRVAIIGDSGGQAGIAADLAGAAGLAVPAFGAELARELARALPPGAATTNPVDLAGAGERDLASYADTVAHVLAGGDVDAAVLTGYFGRYAEDVPGLAERERAVARRLGALAREHGRPLLVHSMAEPGAASVEALWRAGAPAFGDIRSAVRALAGLAALRPLASAQDPTPTSAAALPKAPGYWATREALREQGVPFPPAEPVRTRAELHAATAVLRPPYVLKAGWLAHKTEAGGVALDLAGQTEALRAFDRMRATLGEGEYVLEEQDRRPGVVEVLVGARRDPGFGPVVVVGAGGTRAEVWADTAVELAPVDPATAREMLGRLRCAALLAGWRGRPPTDRDALAGVVAAVSRFVAAHEEITELELNPVRVGPDGVLAVDAFIERRDNA
ncbi:acetate--CoA ligase family protein [Pseudonocardia acaciae]|uniref:acetate--CoA ligase family protein n=1 Tax=Pseudonocardia acaciae TaxID=551276 RepID=UPI00048A8FFD|nr:acetate--CoA ligase family protein [Pseudonocardia acaciae]